MLAAALLLVSALCVALLVAGAGACCPTDAFVLAASGVVLVCPVDVCAVELEGLAVDEVLDGDELAAPWSVELGELLVALLLFIELAEADVSVPGVLGLVAAAPVLAAPVLLFIADGPDVLLPAPQ